MNIQELFIINLKGYRKLRNLSQMQLAELCESSTGYIGEIESGKRFPSVRMIERIAGALKIESYSLFKNEPINLTHKKQSKKLTPSEKQLILSMATSSLSKIIDKF